MKKAENSYEEASHEKLFNFLPQGIVIVTFKKKVSPRLLKYQPLPLR